MRSVLRTVALVTALTFVLVLAAGAWQWTRWQGFMAAPVNPNGDLNLWIAPGTTWPGLSTQLQSLGLARPDWRWRLYGRLHDIRLKAGEFRIPPDQTLDQLVYRLLEGPERAHRLTIVEGWTAGRLRQALADDHRLSPVSRDLSDAELMTALDCHDCPIEGQFLPETYFFLRGTSDLELLQRAHQAMRTALAQAWSERDPELPLDSPEELLIMASIIERETGASGERAEVSGVFRRRLELGMRLQTDPTVVYGLGDDFDGRIRRVHLRTDHPWNTYTRHGLPATAIALPGRAAIVAAARPAEGSALYFVSRGDGTHQFSDTLEQHNAAVDRYIRGR